MSRIIFRRGHIAVSLCIVEQSDARAACIAMNDPDITQYLARWMPISLQEEEEVLAGLNKSDKNFVFGIMLNNTEALIGTMGLHAINWKDGTAKTGSVIWDKTAYSKGYGTEAKMLLLDFAFNTLGLRCILSPVFAFNERSIAYARKCGYEEVGRLPQWIRAKDGTFVDEVHLIVTADRWRPRWEQYLATRMTEVA